MTLGEGKKKVLLLLDEYSSGGVVTVDEDINAKMIDFFDQAQKQVAMIKRILKSYTIDRESGKTNYEMPADFLSPIAVYRNKVKSKMYRWSGNKIVIPEADDAEIEVEYNAFPKTIPQDAKDDWEFEVAPDAAEAMPYFVAAQQLVVDLVVDYGSLMQLYNTQLNLLDHGGNGMTFKNSLYRRD